MKFRIWTVLFTLAVSWLTLWSAPASPRWAYAAVLGLVYLGDIATGRWNIYMARRDVGAWMPGSREDNDLLKKAEDWESISRQMRMLAVCTALAVAVAWGY